MSDPCGCYNVEGLCEWCERRLRAEVERLTADLDHAKNAARVGPEMVADLQAQVERLTRERDEARRQVENIRHNLIGVQAHAEQAERERDEARELYTETEIKLGALGVERDRLAAALRVMLDGCNEGAHHGPCVECEERARAALAEVDRAP